MITWELRTKKLNQLREKKNRFVEMISVNFVNLIFLVTLTEIRQCVKLDKKGLLLKLKEK